MIGKPAGRDAYHGQSAMRYQKQSGTATTRVETAQKQSDDATTTVESAQNQADDATTRADIVQKP